jgi:hypothetical protein
MLEVVVAEQYLGGALSLKSRFGFTISSNPFKECQQSFPTARVCG